MTAIVGVVDERDKKVWIGGDSAGVSGYVSFRHTEPKVFINGEFVIGYTTSFRMGQLLQYCLVPPDPHEGEDGIRYMVRSFIPAVKQCLKDGGWNTNDSGQDEGGTFLVGWRGGLYSVESDYHVSQYKKYHACGSGREFALGSLYANRSSGMSGHCMTTLALHAAEEHCTGVIGPFTILSLPSQLEEDK